ncbi:MAG: hypothetical protein ACR2GQ_02495 [Gemmatimonadota bacterium]
MRKMKRSGVRPTLLLALFVVVGSGCGPKVQTVETAQVREREEDAEVLVFVRDTGGTPQCPWEVLGTIEVKEGWTDDEGDTRKVLKAAARMGGHAVMVETASAVEARVLRFFDPLCNPLLQ